MPQRPPHFRLNMQHPLANGLVFAGLGAHAGSTRYHDSSVYGNTGTLTNMGPSSDWVFISELGRFGFTPKDNTEYVSLGRPTPLITDGPFAFSFWAYWTALTGISRTMCLWQTTGNSYRCAFYFVNSGSVLQWRTRSAGGTNTDDYVLTAPTTSAWHHWAFVFNGTTKTVYTDGVVNGSPSTPTGGIALSDSTANVVIGDDYVGGTLQPPAGFTVADWIFRNRALTQTEVLMEADPSNVMLSGLINPPRRKWWPVAGGTATFKSYWANQATQVAM